MSATASAPTTQAIDGEKIDQIARISHETIRAYREAAEQPPLERWHRMDSEHRNRERVSVKHLLEGGTLEQLHERWAGRLLSGGWRYGETANTTYKTHPSLVPYESLPKHRLVEDRLLTAIVGALT